MAIYAGLGAYIFWGVIPVFWKQLAAIPPFEVVCYRILFTAICLFGILFVYDKGAIQKKVRADTRRMLGLHFFTAVLLSANWLIFVWGIVTGQLVEVSLGYFINPLVSVLLGRIVLGEELRGSQQLAVGLAFLSVMSMGIVLGRIPWLALMLAATFGLYGLLKKTRPIGALHGLALESFIMFPFAIIALYFVGSSHGFSGELNTSLFLLATGPITIFPLVLFAYAAPRIPLSTLGMLQYFAPSLQFLLGVWLYKEPFSLSEGVAFAGIWIALVLYSYDGVRQRRRELRIVS